MFQTPVVAKFAQKTSAVKTEKDFKQRLKEFEFIMEFKGGFGSQFSKKEQNKNQDVIDFIRKVKNFSKKTAKSVKIEGNRITRE